MARNAEYRPFYPNETDRYHAGAKTAWDFDFRSAMTIGDFLKTAPGWADVVIEKDYSDWDQHRWIWHYTVRIPEHEAYGERSEVLARARRYAGIKP